MSTNDMRIQAASVYEYEATLIVECGWCGKRRFDSRTLRSGGRVACLRCLMEHRLTTDVTAIQVSYKSPRSMKLVNLEILADTERYLKEHPDSDYAKLAVEHAVVWVAFNFGFLGCEDFQKQVKVTFAKMMAAIPSERGQG